MDRSLAVFYINVDSRLGKLEINESMYSFEPECLLIVQITQNKILKEFF